MVNYRKEAKGRNCMVRIDGICNFNPETTVLAHLNGAGMGMKANDLHGAWACSDCHDVIDRRTHQNMTQDFVRQMHLEGVIRTQRVLIEEGKL